MYGEIKNTDMLKLNMFILYVNTFKHYWQAFCFQNYRIFEKGKIYYFVFHMFTSEVLPPLDIMGGPVIWPPKALRTILQWCSGGFRWLLNWVPMMPRGACLSDGLRQIFFFPCRNYNQRQKHHHAVEHLKIYWKNSILANQRIFVKVLTH